MEVNSRQLKQLLQNTDTAFEALRENPSSADLQAAYENAMLALNNYIANAKLKLSVNSRHRQ